MDGEILIPIEFDEIIFESDFIITRNMKSFGLYKLDGTLIFKTEYPIKTIQEYLKSK